VSQQVINQDSQKVIEIHLLDYVRVLVQNRWIIARNFGMTVVLIILISFILPRKYVAVTTLMPPQEQEKLSMTSVLSEVSVPGLTLPNNASTAEILLEILKSRSVGEKVLQQHFVCKKDTLPLYRCLKFSSVEMGLLRMRKIALFMLSKQGIITIAVELGNRQLAADVANAYAEALDQVNQEKSVSRAKNSRIYIESQLRETQAKLAEASRRLADFQQQNKAVSLEEQTKSAIQQAGEVKGQIIAKEVQLGVMAQTMKAENPVVIRAQRELEELKREYSALQFGSGKNEKPDDGEFYLPFSDVPSIGLQLAELMREAKVQETVWQLLNQQYYQAKIQEARDTPTVQVLDVATPPIIPSSPKRKVLVAVFGLLSIVLSIFWIFVQRYYAGLADRPEEKQRVDSILNEFRRDYQLLRSKLRR